MDRSPLPALGLLVAATLLGCASGWRVVSQASPAPFAGVAKIAVVAVDYSGVRPGKAPEGATLADDEASLDERFLGALRDTARQGGIRVVRADSSVDMPFVIRPTVTVLDPGSASSRVEMDVKIVAADGRVLDEIALSHASEAPAGRRFRDDGEALGTLVGGYLRDRVGKVAVAPPDDTEDAPAPPPSAAPPPPPPPPPSVQAPPPLPPPALPLTAGQKTKPGKRAPFVPKGKRPKVEPLPPGTPIASSPSFSRREDGTSRIWMEVSSKVDVAETRYRGRASYRLRGAAMIQHNSHLALPTNFFTTPIDRIQLVQVGTDLDLVIDLREDVTPVYRVVETPRGMVLQVDLPKSIAFQREDNNKPDQGRPSARRATQTTSLGTDRQGEPPQSDD
jgi:hypothetical protein